MQHTSILLIDNVNNFIMLKYMCNIYSLFCLSLDSQSFSPSSSCWIFHHNSTYNLMEDSIFHTPLNFYTVKCKILLINIHNISIEFVS